MLIEVATRKFEESVGVPGGGCPYRREARTIALTAENHENEDQTEILRANGLQLIQALQNGDISRSFELLDAGVDTSVVAEGSGNTALIQKLNTFGGIIKIS